MGTPNKDEAIAGLAERAAFLSEKCRLLQAEVTQLKSRVTVIKTNRNEVFDQKVALERRVVELASELEGRMDDANEAIYQQQLTMQELKSRVEGLKVNRDSLLVENKRFREQLRVQLGWYNPGSKRFCYMDVKREMPATHTTYTEPVWVIPGSSPHG